MSNRRTLMDRALLGATVALLTTGAATSFVGVYALVALVF